MASHDDAMLLVQMMRWSTEMGVDGALKKVFSVREKVQRREEDQLTHGSGNADRRATVTRSPGQAGSLPAGHGRFPGAGTG